MWSTWQVQQGPVSNKTKNLKNEKERKKYEKGRGREEKTMKTEHVGL